ncbi:MAG: holo-ACP synthase [Chitinispirillia bacterium]|nr:holo-ACP synthase [Chitinispirillia bacterium]MCL2242022.1 holo-ACP synthase [Chitinispirillia bacterium]
MAIKGMGIDIVEISRLARVLSRYGDKFIGRIYTPAEAAACDRLSEARSAVYYAGRWAAKEAFYKALPAGVQHLSSWQDVQILSDGMGRSSVCVCTGRLREALAGIGVGSVHLSITHERTHCVAVVVLE